MDVNITFMNNYIQEEVYVDQPHSFLNSLVLILFSKLKKTLYDLKQAPRAQYDHPRKFLLENNFKRNNFYTTP